MESNYNMKNSAVVRILQEAKELAKEDSWQYSAGPMEDNLFEWHFTVRGPPDSDFEGGIYHGRILLPSDYPFKPPDIMLLTPNGRFELQRKICLSVSGFHPESWIPSWSIRSMLIAMIAFFPTPSEGAVGALEYPPRERRLLAKQSVDWKCDKCNRTNQELLREMDESVTSSVTSTNDATEVHSSTTQASLVELESSDQPAAVVVVATSTDTSTTSTSTATAENAEDTTTATAAASTPADAPTSSAAADSTPAAHQQLPGSNASTTSQVATTTNQSQQQQHQQQQQTKPVKASLRLIDLFIGLLVLLIALIFINRRFHFL